MVKKFITEFNHDASTLRASYLPNLASSSVIVPSSYTRLGNVVSNFMVVNLPPLSFLIKFIISPRVFVLKNFRWSLWPSGILS